MNFEDKGKVNLVVQDSRTLYSSFDSTQLEVKEEDGVITTLSIPGCIDIKIGECICISKQKYKIQKIEKDTKAGHSKKYWLYVHEKLTKTSNFVLPFLGGVRSSYRWSNNFINSYIGVEGQDYGQFVYLLYRFDGSKNFTEFEELIKEHLDYEEAIDTDPYHVLLKFRIPEEFKEDIKLIIEGKYSQISDKSKEIILKFHGASKDRPIGMILYKSEKRKVALEEEYKVNIKHDAELFDPFYEDQETFKLKYIIEND